jgi:2OG-Fe(II) oxygenase superfamily
MLEDLDTRALREQYRRAAPWPHLVVDRVVEPELTTSVSTEVAGLPRAALVHRTSRRQIKSSSTTPRELGPCTRALLSALSGTAMMRLAEAVTGIAGLESDPEFCRAGVFVTPPGGWQRVHEDFPIHPLTGMWNRVIVLLYCSDWSRGWGGELELWPPDMSSVGLRIEPRPGRLVLFETTSTHPHGVVTLAPAAGPRVVLASRLYAQEPPSDPPSRPLRRWSRRPSEHRRDVLPTASEAVRELQTQVRGRLRPHPASRPPEPGY